MIRNRIAKNTGWLIGGNVVHGIITFLVGALTARYLGPDNYGLINYAAAYTTFFFSICTLGLNSVMLKGMIDHPEREGTLLGSAMMMRGVSSLLSALMIVGIVCIVDRNEPLTIAVVALCSLGMVFRIADSLNIWFQAHLISKYTAIASTIAYIVTSAYKLILLALGKDVRWFAVATSVDYIVVAIILFAFYRKMKGPGMSWSVGTAKAMLGKSYPYILSGLMVAVYGSTDKLMLKQMIGEETVGHYSIAVSLCNMWTFVLSAIIQSFYPVIVQQHSQSRRAFEQSNRLLYGIVFYLSMLVSVGYILFGDWIVGLLYGAEYAPAVAPLKIVTWYVAFSYLGVARDAWMVCEDRQRYLGRLYLGSAVINVLLNMLFIPRWGAVGAAVASLATQMSTILVFPMLIRDLRPNARLMLEAVALKGFRRENH